MKFARLAALAGLALAMSVPAGASAEDPGDMFSSGFFVGGFGVCWYGADRSDQYFGLNVHCPMTPMPGDTHNGG